jgi:hypothetical protein
VQGNPLFYTAWTRSGHDEGVYHALSSRVFFHLGIRVAAISLTIAIKKKITVNVSLFWPAKQAAADIVDTTNTSRSAAGDRGNEFGRLNTRRRKHAGPGRLRPGLPRKCRQRPSQRIPKRGSRPLGAPTQRQLIGV